jgi:type IV secretion system protein VirB6
MWVLIGTAPIFIACMLFEQTRSYGVGWFNQVVIYALIPLFIYVIAAFLIAAMDPELTAIEAAAKSRTLKLSDIAAFVLLCAAGAFILLQIQAIAQGIAGGIAAGIGQMGYSMASYAGIRVPRGAVRGGIAAGRGASRLAGWYRARGEKTPDDAPPAGGNGAALAMQNRISANSTPR